MKTKFALIVSLAICAFAAKAQTDFPYKVPFELGQSNFAAGDSITIRNLTGTTNVITTNEVYCVEGSYTLASRERASLSFFATTAGESKPTPIDPAQTVRITKGTGSFRLIKKMGEQGWLHVSFYDGSSGGVYFGQGKWVLRQNSWRGADKLTRLSNAPKMSEANRAIMAYLGDAVPAPADLDQAYTQNGLMNAVQAAARDVGATLKGIVIDDSEFPYVIGVLSDRVDFQKISDQLSKVKDYDFSGSVGGPSCHTFNLVPWRAFPPGSERRVNHRLNVRMEMLFEKLTAAP